MNTDWLYLKKELDRVEGRVIDFGSYAGWPVQRVVQIDRGYLFWCLRSVPLRPELHRSILRTLARPRLENGPGGRKLPFQPRVDSDDFDESGRPPASEEAEVCSYKENVKTGHDRDKYLHEDVLAVDRGCGYGDSRLGQQDGRVHRLRGPAGAGLARSAWGEQDQHELLSPQPLPHQPDASTAETTPALTAEAGSLTDATENLFAPSRVVVEKPSPSPAAPASSLAPRLNGGEMATDPTGLQSQIAAIQRDDPSLGPAQLIADYEAGPELLRAAVAGMTREELLARPVPGKVEHAGGRLPRLRH